MHLSDVRSAAIWAATRLFLALRRPAVLGFGLACSQSDCGQLKCPEGAVLIPAGTFMMGQSFDEEYGEDRPAHKVTLTKPYCMDRTEVTQSAYWACQNAGKCRHAPGNEWVRQHPRYPADFVRWQDAVDYCTWRQGRLPTEAEWEFAARGSDGRIYPWGSEPPSDEHWRLAPKDTQLTVSDVGTHPKGRSAFGLDDMAGNVAEWVHDCWTDYRAEPQIDPRGPETCPAPGWRLQRGSSWASHTYKDARVTARYGMPPYDSSDQAGFRCAYDAR